MSQHLETDGPADGSVNDPSGPRALLPRPAFFSAAVVALPTGRRATAWHPSFGLAGPTGPQDAGGSTPIEPVG